MLRGRPDWAERMIETLSAFLRTTLIGDPSRNTTLAEEIRVQRLYLDIEQVRFPNRLRVEIDIPPELEAARLLARYGMVVRCSHGPRPEEGFRAD